VPSLLTNGDRRSKARATLWGPALLEPTSPLDRQKTQQQEDFSLTSLLLLNYNLAPAGAFLAPHTDFHRQAQATLPTPRTSYEMQSIYHTQHFPSDWPQGHHQHPTHHVAQHNQHQQVQAQAQAAAVAAAAAQQQHYNRIAGTNGTAIAGAGAIPRGPANDLTQLNAEASMTEENRRVLEWIAQLMKPATRETALLELSKKREQVPELALILWHSFGTCILAILLRGVLTDLEVSWLPCCKRSSLSIRSLIPLSSPPPPRTACATHLRFSNVSHRILRPEGSS
jgi:hypothetical protein